MGSCSAFVLVICFLTRVINGKVVEDETIYNPQRFLVEDFFLLVIKPSGTQFNNELLPSCRSSKLISSFPATSVLLCAPLDLSRPDRNSKSDGKMFYFSLTNIALKVAKSCYISYQIVFQPDSFSNNLNRFMLDFM